MRPTHALPVTELIGSRGKCLRPYPRRGSFEDCFGQNHFILPTPGLRGISKPIYVTHGVFASNDAHGVVPSLGGTPRFGDLRRGVRYLLAHPFFHAAKFAFKLGSFWGLRYSRKKWVYQNRLRCITWASPTKVTRISSFGNFDRSLHLPAPTIEFRNNPVHLTNITSLAIPQLCKTYAIVEN